MKSRIYVTLVLVVLVAFLPNSALAQRENSDIRRGNKEFSSGNYTNAEVLYRSALQQNGASQAAMSNLGSALFREEQYSDAAAAWAKVTENAELNATELAHAFFNKGNAELAERKLDEAIESYKNALRRNCNDEDAKYNLAYAQALKQDEDGGGGDNNQDQDQDQDQDQQDKQDPNEDKQDDKQEQEQQQGEKPESRADAERMADAMQRAEDRTKEKVEKEKAKTVQLGGGKSW